MVPGKIRIAAGERRRGGARSGLKIRRSRTAEVTTSSRRLGGVGIMSATFDEVREIPPTSLRVAAVRSEKIEKFRKKFVTRKILDRISLHFLKFWATRGSDFLSGCEKNSSSEFRTARPGAPRSERSPFAFRHFENFYSPNGRSYGKT